jgi:hypothetical protein
MAYPSRNTNGYTGETKNSSTSSNSAQSGQNFLMIDDTFFMLIDSTNKLLLEPLSMDWSYNQKS